MNYTQGKFNRNEVLSMEEEIVSSLGSYIYPPTAGSFCLMFLGRYPFLSTPISAVIETCQFMIELAACGEIRPITQSHCELFDLAFSKQFFLIVPFL